MKGIFAVREVDYASVFSINTCTLSKHARALRGGAGGAGDVQCARGGEAAHASLIPPCDASCLVHVSSLLITTEYHKYYRHFTKTP